MVRTTLAVLALLLAAGCSGSSLGPDTGGGGTGGGGTAGVTIPAVLKDDLRGATYNARQETLTVNLRSLDGAGVRTRYARNQAFDVAGYQAFTTQESSSQRVFLALFKQSGSVSAGIVGDGGQFTEFLAGGTYARADTFTIPQSGLASYAGTYAGILNIQRQVPGPGDPFDPGLPQRVRGDVLINADFADLAINGGIRNRRVVDNGTRLPDAFLKITPIAANGTFAGKVALRSPEITEVGDYGGLFGGLNARDVAGVTVFNPIDGNSDLIEHGVFVLPKCTRGAASPCP